MLASCHPSQLASQTPPPHILHSVHTVELLTLLHCPPQPAPGPLHLLFHLLEIPFPHDLHGSSPTSFKFLLNGQIFQEGCPVSPNFKLYPPTSVAAVSSLFPAVLVYIKFLPVNTRPI